MREPLRSYVKEEIQARGLDLGNQPATRRVDRDRVQKVYRELASNCHPDRGGNDDIMKGINLFYQEIRKVK